MSIGTPDLNHIKSKTLTSNPAQSTNNEELIDEILLDGHLNITKELLLFQNAEKKYLIGSNVSLPNSHQLINDLVEYFIFPASYLFKKYRDSLISASMTSGTEQSNSLNVNALNNFEKILSSKTLKPICSTPLTILSAYELLVSLCTGCLPNLKELSNTLTSSSTHTIYSINKPFSISYPEDFRPVSAIIDVDLLPDTLRRVRLHKHKSSKPLGFYIRDGRSLRVTPHGVEQVPGVFINFLFFKFFIIQT